MSLAPAVEFAVLSTMKRKEKDGRNPDYWDYATLLKLAIIEDRFADAENFLWEAKPLATEGWMPGTIKSNLDKIITFRKERGEDTAPIETISGLLRQV